MVATRELAGWVEARRAMLIGRLSAVSSFPEATIAEVDRTSISAATKAASATLAATPKLADALGDGALTAAHVDAVTCGISQVEPQHRAELHERLDGLVDIAAVATVDQFATRAAVQVKRIQADDLAPTVSNDSVATPASRHGSMEKGCGTCVAGSNG